MGSTAGIRVEGMKELRSSLKRAGDDLTDLKAAHAEVATFVATSAKGSAPHRSGKLAASTRGGATKTAALIRAGKSAVPYANVIHWGWSRRHIKARPWISTTAQTTEPRWTPVYEAAIQEALDRVTGA